MTKAIIITMSITMLFFTFTSIYESLSENKIMQHNFVNTDPTMFVTVPGQWRTQKFFQQIQLTEGRENRDLGAVAP
jgi:hypothetical protein